VTPQEVSLREFIEARLDDFEATVTGRLDRVDGRLDRIEVQTTAHNGRMTEIERVELKRSARWELVRNVLVWVAKIAVPVAVIAVAALLNADHL
jgi:hypothetical protein